MDLHENTKNKQMIENTFPKKIHITCKNKETIDYNNIWKKCISKWKKTHSNYEIIIYDDNDIYELINTYFPQDLNIIKEIKIGAILADVFRYLILYLQGGIYSDADCEPIKNIDEIYNNTNFCGDCNHQFYIYPSNTSLINSEWDFYKPICNNCIYIETFANGIKKYICNGHTITNNTTIILGNEYFEEPQYYNSSINNTRIAQLFMISQPRQSIFLECYKMAILNIKNYYSEICNISNKEKYLERVLLVAGPIFFTKMINTILPSKSIYIMPADRFCSGSGEIVPVTQNSFIYHNYTASWMKQNELIYTKDTYNKDILLYKNTNHQVMMEWEKSYMEKSIELLNPHGSVLEIGFGLGYSAFAICNNLDVLEYTIVECNHIVHEKIKEFVSYFEKSRKSLKINVINGYWQDIILNLHEIYDCIYFDDYISISQQKIVNKNRFNVFLYNVLKQNTVIGSKICVYANNSNPIYGYISEYIEEEIFDYDIHIPNNCNYEKGSKMYIPMITKIKNVSHTDDIIIKKLLGPTMCFATMCKNEAHCIIETLESCYRFCHYWVVCDTGSTDNTCELIVNFFKEKNIPGELFHDEWVGFGHNKTLMFEKCYKKTDYIIHPDADDLIIGNFDFTYDDSGKLAYNIRIKRGTCEYTGLAIWNNNYHWKICGNAHTTAKCLDNDGLEYGDLLDKDFYLLSRDTGSRSNDGDKYYKDALILEKQFIDTSLFDEDGLNSRSVFYTAQSYYDCEKYEEAMKWYIIYTKLKDTWNEEEFESYMIISECMKNLLFEQQYIIGYLNKAIHLFRDRAEPFYKLGLYYYENKKYNIAYLNFKICKNKNIKDVQQKYSLFIDPESYGNNIDNILLDCTLKMHMTNSL
jgi:hypothetical protein